ISPAHLPAPLAAIVVTLGLLTTTAAHSRLPPSQHWVATWGTAQLAYRAPAPPVSATPPPAPTTPPTPPPGTPQRRFGIPRALPGLSNQTIRMIVRTSIGGSQVRIRLSQAFGATAVTIGSAHLATRAEGASIVAGSDRSLTFSGKPGATLYAGQVLVSDPVALEVRPLSDLAVSLFFPGETGPPTGHTFGLRPTYVSTSGDQTGAAAMTDLATSTESYYWLSGIDVAAPASSGTLVTFGDSITDGDQSTPDTLGMWPALLAARLQGRRDASGIGVVNAAISGNRVLGDNNSGLARLARDVLAVPGVRWMTLMEGINDITGATRSGQAGKTFTAETLIAAYRQVIESAHAQGVRVIGCTLTPYGGSNVFTDEGEAIRQAVNAWIRTGGGFDGVIDFDAATRDPQAPARFRAEADSPDLLHPANPGYALMARAVDLSLFTRRR
ncbi:MAG: SGNH/GDSL hydrolase family protein, partial [Vicinamibacterales bacterium]